MSPFGRLLEMLNMDWDDDRADRRRRGRHDEEIEYDDRGDTRRVDDDDDWDRPRGRRREGMFDGLLD